uniref:Nonstructural protein n=1 Tax=Physostegia virginiana fijivirus TaxID=3075966 RepID=A0AA95Z1V0_9REOV|nr:nonstructural protein [Physostegia virginiana fijivirus]
MEELIKTTVKHSNDIYLLSSDIQPDTTDFLLLVRTDSPSDQSKLLNLINLTKQESKIQSSNVIEATIDSVVSEVVGSMEEIIKLNNQPVSLSDDQDQIQIATKIKGLEKLWVSSSDFKVIDSIIRSKSSTKAISVQKLIGENKSFELFENIQHPFTNVEISLVLTKFVLMLSKGTLDASEMLSMLAAFKSDLNLFVIMFKMLNAIVSESEKLEINIQAETQSCKSGETSLASKLKEANELIQPMNLNTMYLSTDIVKKAKDFTCTIRSHTPNQKLNRVFESTDLKSIGTVLSDAITYFVSKLNLGEKSKNLKVRFVTGVKLNKPEIKVIGVEYYKEQNQLVVSHPLINAIMELDEVKKALETDNPRKLLFDQVMLRKLKMPVPTKFCSVEYYEKLYLPFLLMNRNDNFSVYQYGWCDNGSNTPFIGKVQNKSTCLIFDPIFSTIYPSLFVSLTNKEMVDLNNLPKIDDEVVKFCRSLREHSSNTGNVIKDVSGSLGDVIYEMKKSNVPKSFLELSARFVTNNFMKSELRDSYAKRPKGMSDLEFHLSPKKIYNDFGNLMGELEPETDDVGYTNAYYEVDGSFWVQKDRCGLFLNFPRPKVTTRNFENKEGEAVGLHSICVIQNNDDVIELGKCVYYTGNENRSSADILFLTGETTSLFSPKIVSNNLYVFNDQTYLESFRSCALDKLCCAVHLSESDNLALISLINDYGFEEFVFDFFASSYHQKFESHQYKAQLTRSLLSSGDHLFLKKQIDYTEATNFQTFLSNTRMPKVKTNIGSCVAKRQSDLCSLEGICADTTGNGIIKINDIKNSSDVSGFNREKLECYHSHPCALKLHASGFNHFVGKHKCLICKANYTSLFYKNLCINSHGKKEPKNSTVHRGFASSRGRGAGRGSR